MDGGVIYGYEDYDYGVYDTSQGHRKSIWENGNKYIRALSTFERGRPKATACRNWSTAESNGGIS
ncbi:hypothetical protein GP486_004191 [Trichoglossum hirsutum]|uniref:Uncharacterized protein n=1 Tax=Trichoglossum hirsutum TaxID=265104 RepID=A0A9P8LBV0_9PEZI|nr:hypothetical protein GP486_004191 [Trichoglossum hirsutum]